MKKTILHITYLFIATVLLSSCDDNTIEILDTKSVVVQSYLYANNPVDSFRVTQSIGYSETSNNIVTFDDLSISINDGVDNYLLQSIGDGYYQNLDLIVEGGQDYSMTFETDGTTISSITYIPEKKEATVSPTQISVDKVYAGVFSPPTQTDPITVSWDNTEGEYYYVIVENIEDDPEYINENFANIDTDTERPQIITEPQIISDHNIDTRRDIQFFGTYRIIVYRVNPEYAALYTTSESTSSSLVEPPSNIENGLGIMTGISSDTIYFEVNEL